MWRWRLDTGHEDWRQQGKLYVIYVRAWFFSTSITSLKLNLSSIAQHRRLRPFNMRCELLIMIISKLIITIDFLILHQDTFHYNSEYWGSKTEYNLPGAETGFDLQETKLPTYWSTSFSKICLGMKIGQQINFIVINEQANSLYSLIADGQYRGTPLGRTRWKTLIGSQASLQLNCNKEGFNAAHGSNAISAKARIGILGNEQNNCDSCDSSIGFGTGGGPDDTCTCGNGAYAEADNGDKVIKAMGYVLVQWQTQEWIYKKKGKKKNTSSSALYSNFKLM